MLIEGAIVGVILDQDVSASEQVEVPSETEGEGTELKGKVVACAAAVPWTGGWKQEGRDTETGFEIKAVAVDGSERYLRKGLAVNVMGALEGELVKQAKEAKGSGEKRELHLWVLAAECINGEYWKRREYVEVRRSTEGDLTWGCQTSFELVVFRRVVDH